MSNPTPEDEALRTALNDAFDLLVDVGGALDEAIAARRLGPGQKRAEAASIRSCRFLAETVRKYPWLAGERRAEGRGQRAEGSGAVGRSIYDVPEDRAILRAIHEAMNPPAAIEPPRDERVAEIAELLRIQSEGDANGNLPDEGQTLDRIANICLSKEGTCDECGTTGLVVFTNLSASHRRCATECKQTSTAAIPGAGS